jgi:hypothetical protein
LEIRHRAAGFPHFHSAGGELVHKKGDEKDEEKTEFQLTDSITSSTIGTPASLRSENDQLHLGTSDWDPIGTSNHLHRNKHRKRKERNGTAYKVWIEPQIIPREPVPPDSTIPAGTEILLNSGQ